MIPSETIGVASSPRDGVGAEFPRDAELLDRVAVDVLQRREALLGIGAAMRQPVAGRVVGMDDAVAVDVGGIVQPCRRAVVGVGLRGRCRLGRRRLLGIVTGSTGGQRNQKKPRQNGMPTQNHHYPRPGRASEAARATRAS